MRRYLIAATLLLAGCNRVSWNVPCMQPNEVGTVASIVRLPSTDRCEDQRCRNNPMPEFDHLVVSFTMKDSSTRICKGTWYDEASFLSVGKKVTVTKLSKGSL
jgi:hypothetical protein